MITFISVLFHHLLMLFVAHVNCSAMYAPPLRCCCRALVERQGASRRSPPAAGGWWDVPVSPRRDSKEALQRGAWLQYRDAKRALQKHFSLFLPACFSLRFMKTPHRSSVAAEGKIRHFIAALSRLRCTDCTARDQFIAHKSVSGWSFLSGLRSDLSFVSN